MRMRESFNRPRAIPIRCFCPTDNLLLVVPSMVSYRRVKKLSPTIEALLIEPFFTLMQEISDG
jgi:hypothetical protein